MENAIIKASPALDKHTRAITKSMDTAKKSVFEIAVRLNAIQTEKLAEGAGYKSVVEYAADNFKMAKSTTLNYIRIAANYLTVTTNAKGKPEIKTICCSEKGDDYRIGQLNAITLSADDFKTVHEEGVINTSMSADRIRAAIKEWLSDEPDDEPENEPDNEQVDEQDDEPENDIHTVVKDAARRICHACWSDEVEVISPIMRTFQLCFPDYAISILPDKDAVLVDLSYKNGDLLLSVGYNMSGEHIIAENVSHETID